MKQEKMGVTYWTTASWSWFLSGAKQCESFTPALKLETSPTGVGCRGSIVIYNKVIDYHPDGCSLKLHLNGIYWLFLFGSLKFVSFSMINI